MAVFKSCFCCSLLQGSIITGLYTTVVYLSAFVMELSLVLEGENWVNSGREKGPLPLPAYILVVLHFTVVGLSVIMLYALYQRRVGVLLAWVFLFALLFLPELGIVLFIVIFHWGITNTYGITELVFYSVRAPINIVCILCVHSLHCFWKSQLSTERSLKKLSTLQMIKDTTTGKPSSYKNAGYLGSTSDIASIHSVQVDSSKNCLKSPYGSGTLQKNGSARRISVSLNSLDMSRDPGFQRRYSMASQYSDSRGFQSKGQLPTTDFMPSYQMSYPTSWDPLYMQSVIPDSSSEFNASMYPTQQRIGSMPILSHSRSEQTIFQPPRLPAQPFGMSHMMVAPGIDRYPYHPFNYSHSYDFCDYGPMSRGLVDPRVSSGCQRQMFHPDLSTQSLDRRRCMRRTQSFSLEPYCLHREMDPFSQAYYGYPRHQESKSSIGAESDDFRRYRDVAL